MARGGTRVLRRRAAIAHFIVDSCRAGQSLTYDNGCGPRTRLRSHTQSKSQNIQHRLVIVSFPSTQFTKYLNAFLRTKEKHQDMANQPQSIFSVALIPYLHKMYFLFYIFVNRTWNRKNRQKLLTDPYLLQNFSWLFLLRIWIVEHQTVTKNKGYSFTSLLCVLQNSCLIKWTIIVNKP